MDGAPFGVPPAEARDLDLVHHLKPAKQCSFFQVRSIRFRTERRGGGPASDAVKSRAIKGVTVHLIQTEIRSLAFQFLHLEDPMKVE